MSVKVSIGENGLEYKEGCLVKHRTSGWYGILVATDIINRTYNVLKFDESLGYAYLYYTDGRTLGTTKTDFSIVANRKEYDLTLSLKGDN